VWVFPLLAALVATAFAATLAARFARRRQASDGLWAIALGMYATASVAMFLGSLSSWTPAEFRVYWVLGATLTVPYLAQGELYLLAPRRVADVLFVLLLLGTGFAVARIGSAPVHTASFTEQLPLGREVFGAGTAAHRMPQLYSIPAYMVLLAGALWSAWRMRASADLRNRALGTLGIAAGATIVAIGSGFGAGFGLVPLFSASLAAGVTVMFLGFLRASHS
jgi:hypothetical protein